MQKYEKHADVGSLYVPRVFLCVSIVYGKTRALNVSGPFGGKIARVSASVLFALQAVGKAGVGVLAVVVQVLKSERTVRPPAQKQNETSVACFIAKLYEYASCFSIFKTSKNCVLERREAATASLPTSSKAVGDAV